MDKGRKMEGEERRGEERKGEERMKRRQVWAPSVSMQFVNVSTATHNHMRLASKRLRHGAVNFLPSPLTPPSSHIKKLPFCSLVLLPTRAQR
jgi:hypothetical protein